MDNMERKICSIDGCINNSRRRGWCPKHYARWKKYGDPNKILRRLNGEGTISCYGYHIVTHDGKRKKAHTFIAEKILGRALKKGQCVHHADENRLNNDNTNLVICPSNGYHKLLHQRIRAFKESGDPNWRKCRYCKQYDDIKNLSFDRGQGRHRECYNLYQRQQRLLRKNNGRQP